MSAPRRDPSFDAAVIAAMPRLRKQAITLACGKADPDDMAHQAVLLGLMYHDRFESGTNMGAWLFTIMRNQFRTAYRRGWWEVPDPDHRIATEIEMTGSQFERIELRQVLAEMDRLPRKQQESLRMVALGGTYEEVGDLLDVPEGTIKSRVCRARAELARQMGGAVVFA